MKTENLIIRISPSLKIALEEKARKSEMNVSEYVRFLIRSDIWHEYAKHHLPAEKAGNRGGKRRVHARRRPLPRQCKDRL